MPVDDLGAGESSHPGATALVALAVAIFPGAAVAIGICVAAGIRDLDNAGFAVFVGVHAAASTPIGRRTERLMATALAELHARGRTSDGGSRADWPTAGS